MIGSLRDILADWLMEWTIHLVADPEERAAYAAGILPIMDMRLARYHRELADRGERPLAKGKK